ncbi:MAG: (d)CMP kinase [Chlamydiales bacterium]
MIITIDGAVATGKSTVARKLAQSLGYVFFDTGAMYRAFTYYILKKKVDLHNKEELLRLLNEFSLDIRVYHGDKKYYLDGEEITKLIRSPEVTSKVSEIASIPEVREHMVQVQRELASGVNSVFEGRDMGTTVFPNADLKIYLIGNPEVRAKRRYNELISRDPHHAAEISYDQVLKELIERDEKDSSRETSPLKQASDAQVIDTTDLTADEVVLKILECKDALKMRKH